MTNRTIKLILAVILAFTLIALAPSDKLKADFQDDEAQLDTLARPFLIVDTPTYISLRISYEAVPAATGYQVYRAPKKNGKYKLIAVTDLLSYEDKELKPDTVYFYKVRSFGPDPYSGKTVYSTYSVTKSGQTLSLKKPVMAVVKNDMTSLKLSFSDIDSAADGFQLFRATKKKGKYLLLEEFTGESGYLNSGLTAGKTYYYKIRAFRTIGTRTVYGPYSGIKSSIVGCSYFTSKTGTVSENNKAYKAAAKIIEEQGWSLDLTDEFELACKINRYVSESITYKSWPMSSRYWTAYSGLVKRSGSCWAYAHAYLFLAKQVGLDVRPVYVRNHQIDYGFIMIYDYETDLPIGYGSTGSDHCAIIYSYKGFTIRIEPQTGTMYFDEGDRWYQITKDPAK